jgi:hypothetical protein
VLKNALPSEALRLIAEAFDLSTAAGPLPRQRISLRLPNTTAKEALEALASAIDHDVIRSPEGIVRLVPTPRPVSNAPSSSSQTSAPRPANRLRRVVVGDFQAGLDQVLSSLESRTLEVQRRSPRIVVLWGAPDEVQFASELLNSLRAEPISTLATRLFRLGAASGAGVLEGLNVVLGDGERATYDAATHALTVTATHEALSRVERWLGQVESELPQFEIEIRMVEVGSSAMERSGLDWNIKAGVLGGTLPSTFPHKTLTEDAEFLPSPSDVLAGAGQAENSSFVFSMLDAREFSVFLELVRQDGEAKVLSSPKVVTLHNHEAVFESLTTLRIPTFTRNEAFATTTTSGVETVEFGTSLRVRPRLDKGGNIYLTVEPAVSKLDGIDDSGFPTVSLRRLKAEVLLADGETLVLGGLVRERTVEVVKSVPVLGDIPLLKHLFQHTTTEATDTELLIFITPRVLPSAATRRDSAIVDGVWIPKKLADRLTRVHSELETGVPSRVQRALGQAETLDAEALTGGLDLLPRVTEIALSPAFEVRLAAARFVFRRRPMVGLELLSRVPDGRQIAVGLLSESLAPHLRQALASQLARSPESGSLVEKELLRALTDEAPRRAARLLRGLQRVAPQRARERACALIDDSCPTLAAAAVEVLYLCGRNEDRSQFERARGSALRLGTPPPPPTRTAQFVEDRSHFKRAAQSEAPEIRLRASLAAEALQKGTLRTPPDPRDSVGVDRLGRDSAVQWATSEPATPTLEGLTRGVELLEQALALLARRRPDYAQFVKRSFRKLKAGTVNRVDTDLLTLELVCEGDTPQQLAHHLVHWAHRVFEAHVNGLPVQDARALAESVREEVQALEALTGARCSVEALDRTVKKALERVEQ